MIYLLLNIDFLCSVGGVGNALQANLKLIENIPIQHVVIDMS